MNTNSVKKIQEQIEVESKSRRNYPRKWSKFYQEAPWKEMYNQDEVNRQIKMESTDPNAFVYPAGGDSYFVSPQMFKSLVAECRCGRPRRDLHLLKCLQNQQNKYLRESTSETNDKRQDGFKLPQTSSEFVGWPAKPAKYKQWENSMKYVSPVCDMPGQKITATSYDVIMIG